MNQILKRKLIKGKRDISKLSPTILIDCSGVVYQSLYTMGHLSYNGIETGVIFGFLKKILSMAKRFDTDDFIFCWDSGKGYRDLVYPNYKIHRLKKRESYTQSEVEEYHSLLSQSEELYKTVLLNLGFMNNFRQRMYEADDLLAYWANKLRNKQNRTIMVTSDVDMYQCLDYCDIWSDTKKKFMTKKILRKDFGVEPSQWAMAKAIGGCSSDGVIGIVGVSDPKNKSSKSLKYLQGKLKDGKIKQKIESEEGQAIIKINLPIVTTPYRPELMKRMIKRKNKYSRKKFVRVFDKYHFKSFLSNLNEWENCFLSEKGNQNGFN